MLIGVSKLSCAENERGMRSVTEVNPFSAAGSVKQRCESCLGISCECASARLSISVYIVLANRSGRAGTGTSRGAEYLAGMPSGLSFCFVSCRSGDCLGDNCICDEITAGGREIGGIVYG